MNYKKIIKCQQIRFKILAFFRWIPDGIMLRIQYRIKMGYWPNFKHPKRFTEKLQLYKMRYRNPEMHQCVDKYEVRKYVDRKGLKHILNELYGVYNKPEDIDFSVLPQSFVIKTTNGGGGLNVIVVKDKNKADFNNILKKLSGWHQQKKSSTNAGREWAYDGDYPSRIIIEKNLEDSAADSLTDYKIFCFNGEPKCVQVDTGRFDGHHQNYYDMQWQSLGVHCTYPEGEPQQKPQNFEEMKRIAGMLAKEFPFVRVDLYNVNGTVYFGELTFYPSSGYGTFHPGEFDFTLGSYFTKF